MQSFGNAPIKTPPVHLSTIEDEQGLIDLTVLPYTQEKHAKAALGCALLLIRKTGPESISITAERLLDLRSLARRLA